jgi:hypothetical protein
VFVIASELSYDNNYVIQGEPNENLKGDLYFIAKQMGLKYPIAGFGSREETLSLMERMRRVSTERM